MSQVNEETVQMIVNWFHENYEDPANGVPHDDGQYAYVLGGPYDASNVLHVQFDEFDDDTIDQAVSFIESGGTGNWVKAGQY